MLRLRLGWTCFIARQTNAIHTSDRPSEKMATKNKLQRRVDIFNFASSTEKGAGPYEEVFLNLKKKSPFESTASFQKKVRVTYVEMMDSVWIIELYNIIERLDVLEVSAQPQPNDKPTFVVPRAEKSFATRTCAVFNIKTRTCCIEYVHNGPKSIDFSEILSQEAFKITQKKGTHFALTPVIGKSFLSEIKSFERIRQVRVVFERPNPGWGDIGILADAIEGSGDARREVVLTAPRSGSIKKTKGILEFITDSIKSGTTPMSSVVVEGKRPGDAGETRISSEKSVAKQVVSLPITENEGLYRRGFVAATLPMFGSQNGRKN
ncbi:hypothetical protein ACVFYP_10220 [Roseomonas sp. F4]